MITVSKGALKNKMLEYFRNIENTGNELIVTDRNKPVLRIVPIKKNQSLLETFSEFQGYAKYHSPITEPETDEWGDAS